MSVRKTKTISRSAKQNAKGSSGGKKTSAGKKKSHSWVILFWLAFAIFIFGLFIVNRETITGSIQTIKKEYSPRRKPVDDKPSLPLTTNPLSTQTTVPATPTQVDPPVQTPQVVPPVAPTPVVPAPVTPPITPPPAAPASNVPQTTPATTSVPPAVPPSSSTTAPVQPAPRPVERRERTLYFTQVDRDGSILRVKVNRTLPVSASPMTDVIQALIGGPNAEEKARGLISLVPPDSKILSATVRGDIAYISFSEDFQYNTYGVEGYAGQVRQIVFTATEFPNVKSVQILVEGSRIDYLGEGVWIGSPLSREMF